MNACDVTSTHSSPQAKLEQEERLWASQSQSPRDGSGPSGDPWVPHPPPSEDDPADEGVPPELLAARQTALLELMHSLQELSNHLRVRTVPTTPSQLNGSPLLCPSSVAEISMAVRQ